MSKILVTQAIARGWCSPKNSHKILDVDLAVAIADEIMAALTPADDVVRDAARYQWLRENVHREYARKSINPEFQDYNMKWMITPYLIATTAIDSDVPFDEAVDIAMEKAK